MIIVTGASGGIGIQVVEKLKKIDTILAVYHTATLTEEQQEEDNIRWIQANLLEVSGVERVCDELKKIDPEQITVVCLSAIKKDELVVNCELETWNNVLNLNVTSVFYLTKLLLPLMIKKRWGRFIFATSTGGVRGDVGTVSYSTSKTAILGFSKVISKEYPRFNITSNIISLGTFDTGLFHDLDEEKQKEILKSIPSRKLGCTSNISNAIEFIIKSEYVNGSVIHIDGGM